MLKMYHRNRHEGGAFEYWRENWRRTSLEDTIRFCEVDPLRPFFERHVRPGDVMLEGGCGVGQYVAFYSDRGVKAVGLDFERVALSALHRSRPSLPLCAGDVARLPFRDGSFDCYYSGGIVEHFEAGACASLREARRVLRRRGVLLITVPYFSPLRRLLTLISTDKEKRVGEPCVDAEEQTRDLTFFQYAYKVDEFTSQLANAGFRVVSSRGFSILWGLYELPLLRRLVDVWRRRREHTPEASPGRVTAVSDDSHDVSGQGRQSLLKRLVVSEDTSIRFLGWLVRALGWGCANMMLYVCVRADH